MGKGKRRTVHQRNEQILKGVHWIHHLNKLTSERLCFFELPILESREQAKPLSVLIFLNFQKNIRNFSVALTIHQPFE